MNTQIDDVDSVRIQSHEYDGDRQHLVSQPFNGGHWSDTAYDHDGRSGAHTEEDGSRETAHVENQGKGDMLKVQNELTPDATQPEKHLAQDVALAAGALGVKPPNEKKGRSPPKGSAGVPGGPSGPGGRPQLKKFAYSFWAPEMKYFRKITIKILGPATILSILVIWACLLLYWGSCGLFLSSDLEAVWKSYRCTPRTTVRVIDRDGGSIGTTLSEALLGMNNLDYFQTSPSEFPTNDDVAYNVVEEGSWTAIVINSGATNALATARRTGDSTYNGTSAITVFYSQARNELATGNYLVSCLQQDLGMIVGRLSSQSVAQYLQANSGNVTAIAALADAPGTLVNSIYWTMDNLRPYNQPAATAITLVGLIYLLIFAFIIIIITNNAVRENRCVSSTGQHVS